MGELEEKECARAAWRVQAPLPFPTSLQLVQSSYWKMCQRAGGIVQQADEIIRWRCFLVLVGQCTDKARTQRVPVRCASPSKRCLVWLAGLAAHSPSSPSSIHQPTTPVVVLLSGCKFFAGCCSFVFVILSFLSLLVVGRLAAVVVCAFPFGTDTHLTKGRVIFSLFFPSVRPQVCLLCLALFLFLLQSLLLKLCFCLC